MGERKTVPPACEWDLLVRGVSAFGGLPARGAGLLHRAKILANLQNLSISSKWLKIMRNFPKVKEQKLMSHKLDIIIALDGISEREALRIARLMSGLVWGFKINDLLFGGVAIIRKLKKFGRVFADAKLHDIPNTVAHSVERLSAAGADMITVHASGGVPMMAAAKQKAGRSKILAVTVLTSEKENKRALVALTRSALEAGVDGIVSSGRDLEHLRSVPGSERLFKVVPGIRPSRYRARDDQKRTVTPSAARMLGADYLVIGRPILNATDPLKALRENR